MNCGLCTLRTHTPVFPSFPEVWHSSHGRRLRVTVVTLDLVTPTRKGEPRLLLQLRCSLRQIVLGKIGLTHVTRLVTVS